MKMRFAAIAVLAAAALVGACDDEDTRTITDVVTVTVRDTIRIGNTTTTFDQIEYLANPLVSEVFVEKREHPHYNNIIPSESRAEFRDDLVSFMTTVAGRDAAYAGAVADALLPDMLVVRMDRAAGVTSANVATAATVGWLTHALDPANGYGGRKLDGDDAVDKGLSVIFGNALGNNNNNSPGLVTDNVPDTKADLTAFPYVAAPNP
ncbi:MAG TPA: DUF4331 family protein [Longimicrobium sp.]|jgi:hypothetical protein